MIKAKNKQIHKQKKQTNKKQKKHFKDPKYISQIKSDLHEIFREASCGCSMMIKTKNKEFYKQTNKQTF